MASSLHSLIALSFCIIIYSLNASSFFYSLTMPSFLIDHHFASSFYSLSASSFFFQLFNHFFCHYFILTHHHFLLHHWSYWIINILLIIIPLCDLWYFISYNYCVLFYCTLNFTCNTYLFDNLSLSFLLETKYYKPRKKKLIRIL